MRGIALFFCFVLSGSAFAQTDSSPYFKRDRIRYSFFISVQDDRILIRDDAVYHDGTWVGHSCQSRKISGLGEMAVSMRLPGSCETIFTTTFSSLFHEWLSLPRSGDSIVEFHESLLLPLPELPVDLVIEQRDAKGIFRENHVRRLVPEDILPLDTSLRRYSQYRVITQNGPAAERLDLVFVSAGFGHEEAKDFFRKVQQFSSTFSHWSPYNEHLSCLNIAALFIPAGNDTTGTSLTDSLCVNYNFNTLGIERYLMTDDLPLIKRYLSGYPYDQICLLVNSDRYGGGGIYNYLTVFTAGHYHSEFLFQHELAHTFACLADEYYTSQVSYNNIFPLDLEPYQPNITTLIDFGSKWKDSVHDSVPVPTPNLRLYNDVVGVFEGAGYRAEGIYRPYYNCSMKSAGAAGFCPVCQQAIVEMLREYCNSPVYCE